VRDKIESMAAVISGLVLTLCAIIRRRHGADAAELVVPMIQRWHQRPYLVCGCTLRVQTPVERRWWSSKGTASGIFSAATLTTLTMSSGNYEISNSGSLGSVSAVMLEQHSHLGTATLDHHAGIRNLTSKQIKYGHLLFKSTDTGAASLTGWLDNCCLLMPC
jgi:hypothetical protein